jgi:glycosyltransferase involved in cell wall biosynthesis
MGKPRVVVVMPAYNAAKTLERTYADLPKDAVDKVILVDDVSRDETVEIARRLGLKVVIHVQNRGYGGNQKTCYLEALKDGADVVVMLHPDYQYDSRLVPELIGPILQGKADMVYGDGLPFPFRRYPGGWHARVQVRVQSVTHFGREPGATSAPLRMPHRFSSL